MSKQAQLKKFSAAQKHNKNRIQQQDKEKQSDQNGTGQTAVGPEGKADVQAYANQLGNAGVPAVQRQELAAHLGQQGGNMYLQQVMLQMKQEEDLEGVQETAFAPEAISSEAMPVQRELVDDDAADQINPEDIEYEVLAHLLAYETEGIPSEAAEWLSSRGFETDWEDSVSGSGFFAGLIMPTAEGGRNPVICFKGTTPTDPLDILADLDPVAVGFQAFMRQREEVEELIDTAGGMVDVVGHSLGGALAQHAAVMFPSSINRVVAFQAPGINALETMGFDEEEGPDVTYHLGTGDLVDLAGQDNLPGDIFLHDVGNSPLTHLEYLLANDAFREQRESVGLDDEMMEQLGIADSQAEHTGDVEQYDEYPFWMRRGLVEGAREGVGFSPLTMGIEAIQNVGDAIGDFFSDIFG